MASKNTYACRGCGKPFLESAARKVHEHDCAQADLDQIKERETADQMNDQDQHRETPPETKMDIPTPVKPQTEPKNPEVPVAGQNQQDTCQCCGATVNTTTRSGLCYGCELAGCSPGGTRCKHHGER